MHKIKVEISVKIFNGAFRGSSHYNKGLCCLVYITRNGKGDLEVLSIEVYEKLVGKFELRHTLLKGIQLEEDGNVITICEYYIRAN